MKITKRQLRRIIREERAELNELGPGMVPTSDSDLLGAKIEEAIALAQKTRNTEVLLILEEAHEALIGY